MPAWYYVAQCPCRLNCSIASWKRARVRGATEELCRDQLSRHLTNSHLHQDLHAVGPEYIERIVQSTEVKLWNPSGYRERSRSRDSPPPTPPPSPSPAGHRASATPSPSPAPVPRQPVGYQDSPPWVVYSSTTSTPMPDPDDVVTIPADELIQISVTLEVAAFRIRSLVDGAAASFDV